jgi:hypothetical protein
MYPKGVYTGRVRVYIDGTDMVVAQDTFNISLLGNNPMFCLECPKCEKTACNSNSCPSIDSCRDGFLGDETPNESQGIGKHLIHVISYDDHVPAGSVLKALIKIENVLNATEKFSVYSYIFNGSRCVSLGFDRGSWRNVWDANKKTSELSNGSSFVLALENMIDDETVPGIYKFRIRLKYGDETKDVTKDITVTPPLKKNSSIIPSTEKTFTDSPSPLSKSSVTGMAIKQDSGILSIFSAIYNNVALWVASLFKF